MAEFMALPVPYDFAGRSSTHLRHCDHVEHSLSVSDASQSTRRFGQAYQVMFQRVEMLITRTGRVRQEVIGLDFQTGVAVAAQVKQIEQSGEFRPTMEKMQASWPIVAHVFQGWSVRDASPFVRLHGRCEVVVIALHGAADAWRASCRVERPAQRRIPDASDGMPGVVRVISAALRPLADVRRVARDSMGWACDAPQVAGHGLPMDGQ